MKGLENFISHMEQKDYKGTTKRPASRATTAKPPPRRPTRSARDRKLLRVRKTVQNRRIDLLATDSDRRNRRRWHISGEVSPQQRCHCSSILVSPRKDVGVVTAEYTGH